MSLRHQLDRTLRALEQDYRTHNLIEVSAASLLHNFELYAKITGQAIIPVLKSNAYGHGLELVAEALKARRFPYIAVDGYFEALQIREVSDQPVLVMGAILPVNFAKLKLKNFAFSVHDTASIDALGRRGDPVKIHLEINTGMNRYGIEPGDIEAFVKQIQLYPNIEFEGVMSHLADSDGLHMASVEAATQLFDEAVDQILDLGATPKYLHLAQSAGAVKALSRHANAIRLGLGLYGINPLDLADPRHGELAGLRPALKLTSMITQTHQLKPGDGVSYNYTFTAPRPMTIGVLPLGYYEGVQRSLSNTGTVLVGRKPVSIVGRVCMNHTMIDLGETGAKTGDMVTVLSDNPADPNSVGSIARDHDLFSYMHLTSLDQNLRRVLIDD